MPFKITTFSTAVIQSILNFIFIIPINAKIILAGGGPMGIGLLVISFTIPLSILSIGSLIYLVMTLRTMGKLKISLFLNGLSLIMTFLFVTMIILPSKPSILAALEDIWSH